MTQYDVCLSKTVIILKGSKTYIEMGKNTGHIKLHAEHDPIDSKIQMHGTVHIISTTCYLFLINILTIISPSFLQGDQGAKQFPHTFCLLG